jgi:hypothetical protein
MLISRRHLPTVPAGLIISRIEVEPDRISIFAATRSASALCPSCGSPSRRLCMVGIAGFSPTCRGSDDRCSTSLDSFANARESPSWTPMTCSF